MVISYSAANDAPVGVPSHVFSLRQGYSMMTFHPFAQGPSGRKRGFTLVELLVVIGIIALLISILLPSLSRAREQAKSIKCASNLRTIAQAMQMYASENQGFLAWYSNNARVLESGSNPVLVYVDPCLETSTTNADTGAVTWDYAAYWAVHYAAHSKLPKETLNCPSEIVRSRTGSGDGMYSHYGLNIFGSAPENFTRQQVFGYTQAETALYRQTSQFKDRDGNSRWVGKTLGKIKNGPEIIFAQDSYEHTIDGNKDTFWNFQQHALQYKAEYIRHNKRANCVFVDGHVESLSEQDLEDYRWYTGRKDLPLLPKP